MEAIFFPRNDYPNNVEVCAHRLGKKMTFTECSDGLKFGVSYDWVIAEAKRRNIKLSNFAVYYDYANNDFYKAYNEVKNGNLWLDIYSYNPAMAEKLDNRQPITEEEWLDGYYNYLLPLYRDAMGKKPVAMSASLGNTTFSDYVTQVLSFKNSVPQGSSFDTNIYPTDYGIGYGNPNDRAFGRQYYIPRPNTSRWFDDAIYHGAEQDNSIFYAKINTIAEKIDETLEDSGWFVNFTHWHWAYNPTILPQIDYRTEYEAYFDMLAQKNVNGEIYFAGYGEAVAYLVYRQIITKVAMYSPAQKADTLIIQLETKNSLNIDTDLLQVPVSVKFSTVGTPLENKEIESESNLINLGDNEYIIEISYNEYPRGIITEKYL